MAGWLGGWMARWLGGLVAWWLGGLVAGWLTTPPPSSPPKRKNLGPRFYKVYRWGYVSKMSVCNTERTSSTTSQQVVVCVSTERTITTSPHFELGTVMVTLLDIPNIWGYVRKMCVCVLQRREQATSPSRWSWCVCHNGEKRVAGWLAS